MNESCAYCKELLGDMKKPCWDCPANKKEEGDMPNVNDLNKYLAADDVKDGDELEFINAGEFVEKDFSEHKDGTDMRTVLEIGVRLPNGKAKTYSPNVTSQKAIKAKYTPDTEAWVGKKVKVLIARQNVGGTFKQVLYTEPV